MKALLGAAGGVLGAAAAAGPPALIGLAVLCLVSLSMLCWIIANRARTENTVALITATRHPGITGAKSSRHAPESHAAS